MLLGFKTQLKLNQNQRQQLARHAGVARHAYNWGNDLCLAILDHKGLPKNKLFIFKNDNHSQKGRRGQPSATPSRGNFVVEFIYASSSFYKKIVYRVN